MDLKSLSNDEIKALEPAAAKEAEQTIRKRIADVRMDIYTPKSENSAELKSLKRNLARVLTRQNEKTLGKQSKAKG